MHFNNNWLRLRPARAGRDGLQDLLRRPLVGLVLVLSAVAQVVAVDAKGQPAEAIKGGAMAQLGPSVIGSAAPSPARTNRVERNLETVVAAYRAEGYGVTGSLARVIREAAVEHGIDPEIAFGLVRAESGFRSGATSRVGAVGLTQVMPRTAREVEPGTTRTDLRDPETNLRIGFKYLRTLIDRFGGDVDLALTAYNRGPGTVTRVLRRGGNPDNGYADFVRTGNRGRHRG